jgi:hypothetical protein
VHEAEGVWAQLLQAHAGAPAKGVYVHVYMLGMCPSGRLDCMQVVVCAASLSGKPVCLCCV